MDVYSMQKVHDSSFPYLLIIRHDSALNLLYKLLLRYVSPSNAHMLYYCHFLPLKYDPISMGSWIRSGLEVHIVGQDPMFIQPYCFFFVFFFR